jgi:L-2,4-diaminobutyrate decarboxylase
MPATPAPAGIQPDSLRPSVVHSLPDLDAALAGGGQGAAALGPLLEHALAAVAKGSSRRAGPAPVGTPADVKARFLDALGDPLPLHGSGSEDGLAMLVAAYAAYSVDPADPACAAHLQCPPLAVAVAADMAAAILNASLDSWDQAPAGTLLERSVIRSLAGLAGYDRTLADGVMTPGGTASNMMGLLLAREQGARRVLCSEDAHFSVARAAELLGLGTEAVDRVPVDAARRMDPAALGRALGCSDVPACVVATAGTTNFGSIDPLPEVARVTRAAGAWLHTDAAYGGGVLFSSRLAPLLDGLVGSDSLALDLHKLGWQPVPAGVFLVRDAASLSPLAQRVAYLNPADDENAGYTSRLGRSLQTTRRADVLKVAVTLRALGVTGLGALVERCHDLAAYAADRVDAHPSLDLTARPVLTTVVFAYHGGTPADRRSNVNGRLRRRLLRSGRAVVGRTEVGGEVHLKLTLLNPYATEAGIDALLDAIAAAGEEEDR